MLAWIAIYSLFESIDFVDEVVILFGEITFWTSVLLSVVIALGESNPHTLPSPLLTVVRRPAVLGKVLQVCLSATGQGHRARNVGTRRFEGSSRHHA